MDEVTCAWTRGVEAGTCAPSALRLTFQYDEHAIWLLEARRLAKLAPPCDPLSGYDGQQGFWIELRSADDRTIYRRVLDTPFHAQVEVYGTETSWSIARVPRQLHRGVVVVDVPYTGEAEQAVLFSSAAPWDRPAVGPTASVDQAIEIARIPLLET